MSLNVLPLLFYKTPLKMRTVTMTVQHLFLYYFSTSFLRIWKKKLHPCHNATSWQHWQQQTLEMYKNCVFILWMVQKVIRSLEDKIAWGKGGLTSLTESGTDTKKFYFAWIAFLVWMHSDLEEDVLGEGLWEGTVVLEFCTLAALAEQTRELIRSSFA